MAIPEMTEDEIINILKHSRSLNIIVEGIDDCTIYRRIEEKVGNVDLIICSGRILLLNIFERREEFRDTKYVFVADQDLFLFSETPERYNEIIWTKGYSIENDLLNNSGIVDCVIEKDKAALFNTDLRLIIKWFSHELYKAKIGDPFKFDIHPKAILNSGTYTQSFQYLDEITCDIPASIIEKPYRSIRGKNITSLISMYFNENSIGARCNDKALLLMALVAPENDFYKYTLPSIAAKCETLR